MQTKLKLITSRARRDRGCRFTSLAYLLNEGFLARCFWELKRGKAPGIDGVRWEEYAEKLTENLRGLVSRLKAKRYGPQPVKRVYVPKDEKSLRPLGLPVIEDKVVQMGIARILGAIFEVDFLEVSYGFRPNRSCHEALDRLDKAIMTKPVNCIVEADIKGFFDHVDHKWLMECLRQRISDPSFLRLIGRFLRAGIMEEGRYIQTTEEGTPQGGVLSPVLSNVYLHYVLDLWFERRLKRELSGYAEENRYADDFVICLQNKGDGERVLKALRERFAKFGLSLSEEKTRLLEFGRHARADAERCGERPASFDYLGFTHFIDRTRRGKFKVGRRSSRKKFRAKMKAMNEWLKSVRNAVRLREWWVVLRAKLLGHYRYYGVSGNLIGIKRYYLRVLALVYKWINRRSQKRSYNRGGFAHYLEYYPLPKPRIYRNLYTLSAVK
ncbi:MAG: group II intron reverse transcriptase/maturase [Nitrospiraceae bacterium]